MQRLRRVLARGVRELTTGKILNNRIDRAQGNQERFYEASLIFNSFRDKSNLLFLPLINYNI